VQSASPKEQSSKSSASEIVAIRLLKTDGTQPKFDAWLTDPDRLKYYIGVFNQPSSSIKPLQVIFVLKNDGQSLLTRQKEHKIILHWMHCWAIYTSTPNRNNATALRRLLCTQIGNCHKGLSLAGLWVNPANLLGKAQQCSGSTQRVHNSSWV
jgi:hypothetical protein